MTVYSSISKLISYGLSCGLIEESDKIFTTNRILEILHLDEYEQPSKDVECESLEETLAELLDFAVEKGLIGDDITSRDLFDTKLMGIFTPLPREIAFAFSIPKSLTCSFKAKSG